MVNNTKEFPQIDVLLATYNGEKYLREQIDSILSQTYKNWNLLVRDDGSSDNTIRIIESYRDLVPDRIVVLKDDLGNLGVIRNFSKLLGYSHSDYIMLSDQDDMWLPRKIELTYKKMQDLVKKYGDDVPLLVYTDWKVVDVNLSVISNSGWRYFKVNPRSGKSLAR
ncbi:MAG: glycosyltransferase [Candidatus Bathyarchaeota archaeon]|nr:glycosyltransferase [Candidatus Bathyarchaeota archaeon]